MRFPLLLLSVFFVTAQGAAQTRGARLHDGFYFRYANGPGFFNDSIDSNAVGAARLSGLAFTGEWLIGGTPAPGLVLFVGSAGAFVPSPSLEIEGTKANGPERLYLSIVGVGADYYFDPRGGWHTQAMLGIGYLQTSSFGDLNEAPSGISIVLGAGHEWWIHEQWSLGVLGRIEYGHLTYEDGPLDEEHTIIVPGLVGSVTYH